MALPLITIPYLTRTLGTEGWGSASYALSIANYIGIIPLWGFNLPTTRAIAQASSDSRSVSREASLTLYTQLLLFFAASTILLAVAGAQHHIPFTLACTGILTILGNALTVSWLCSGLQINQSAAFTQILIRLAATAGIFIFVRSPNDNYIYLILIGSTPIISNCILIAYLKKKYRIGFYRPTLNEQIRTLKASTGFFTSALATSTYTALTPFVISITLGPMAAGYFALADRLRQAMQSVISPIQQALYPHVIAIRSDDPARYRQAVLRAAMLLLPISAAGTYFLNFFAREIIQLAAGPRFDSSIQILTILSPLIFIVTCSNILGLQILLPLGLDRAFNRILKIGAIFQASAIGPAIYFNSAQGAAAVTVTTETIIAILMAIRAHNVLKQVKRNEI